ncbi:MAG: hypothetical protein ACLQLG_13595 [Thermoguttaceae bacterium]
MPVILPYPETRQVFCYDCGANALASMLVYAGVEEREDRIAILARTSEDGTDTRGYLGVLDYYGLPYRAGGGMTPGELRFAVDRGWPTALTLQAYRCSSRPYRDLWDDGHWVVAIGYDRRRILFEDPSSYHRTWLADGELLERWHDVDAGRQIFHWGCTLRVRGVYRPKAIGHMD